MKTRNRKRKGNLLLQKYVRKLKNEYNRHLASYKWFKNEEYD